MNNKQSADQIRKYAKALDDAIESRNNEEIISGFSENCEIELPGVKLFGKEGLRKALIWMDQYLKGIVLVPITIMVDGNTLFEEFIVRAKVKGKEIRVKQTEVLVYDHEYKVKSLRLYFDRLELAASYTSNPLEKMMIDWISKASLRGLL